MKIGIAADHGGFELKKNITEFLKDKGVEVVDFGANTQDKKDDYPDFVIPLAEAVADGKMEKGIAICGSGVGVSIAVNKVKNARAALINDCFSAHQGVEDDNMNIMCLGGKVTKAADAFKYIMVFLNAKFSGETRHCRRIEKVQELEKKWDKDYWKIF